MTKDCKFFESHYCRSCALLEHSYSKQCELKQNEIITSFDDNLKNATTILPFVPSNSLFHSRNKAKLAVSGKPGALVLGFPKQDGSILALEDCPLHSPGINELALITKQVLSDLKVTPYNIKNKSGELKYLLIRISEKSGDLMLRFVLRSMTEKVLIEKAKEVLLASNPKLKVVSINLQPEPKAIVEGKEEFMLTDVHYLIDTLGKYELVYSPQSFSQVTSNVAEKLYSTAATWIAECGSKDILDLYCGVGAFSIFCASNVTSVTGIEINSAAIADAQLAAKRNSLDITFFDGDVDAYIKENSKNYDTVIVNPPRRGLGKDIIQNLMKLRPQHLFYSSCNLKTLSEDLTLLSSMYSVIRVQGFDMFPGTEHLECLVQLNLMRP